MPVGFRCPYIIPHPQYEVTGNRQIPYEYHGLPFSKMPPKQHKRVILLGNSVLKNTEVVDYMLALRHALPKRVGKVEIANFSMAGTTIADYIFFYNYVKKFEPDLLIVHLDAITFGTGELLYRKNAQKIIFHADMKALWNPLILSTFDRNDLVESFVYSHCPLYRWLFIIKYTVQKKINAFCDRFFGIPVMDLIPSPLEPVAQWDLIDLAQWDEIRDQEFPQARALLSFFIDQLEHDRQKTVFIRQETESIDLPIFDVMDDFVKDKKYVNYHDFHYYYDKHYFEDPIHPDAKIGSLKVAMRLLQVIGEYLKP